MSGGTRLYHGDCLDLLPTLAAGSARCCVTSPPYFGLRSYLGAGHDDKAHEIGTEETPDAYVARLVEVFRAVRRVLTDDGTLWLNLGDSYASGPGGGVGASSVFRAPHAGGGASPAKVANGLGGRAAVPEGLKPKDLIGIPWRVAFALQADGWYLRSDIIWHKPNAMPESVRDRPTKAHEYLFLLAKSERYFYDADAVRERHTDTKSLNSFRDAGRGGQAYAEASGMGRNAQRNSHSGRGFHPGGRNRRSVWTIPTKPYSGAHFAVMPEALVTPCILAGSAPGDTILDPFAGSGTVGAVALGHGRGFVGIDLNAEYLALAEHRIATAQPPLPMAAD